MNTQELLRKFAEQRITPEEARLFRTYQQHCTDAEREIFAAQYDAMLEEQEFGVADQDAYKALVRRIRGWESIPSETTAHRVHFLKTAWFRYAAVLLLIAGTATFAYIAYQPSQKELVHPYLSKQPTDILPGGNKAILTLSDGSTIVLDSAANGALASDGNTQIRKTGDGSLAYQPGAGDGELLYNTISTPKGGQYQISLPDGSKVWLNAASSVRFPTRFGDERAVTISGEAYLEIAKDRSKPFFVEAGSERIEVLGTRFNVNAYINESAITTTLLEGSVQIGQTVLKPGEAYSNGKKYATETDRAIAWKNGLFNFQDADLSQVMRQLERWYDIEVKMPEQMPKKDFYGEMSRDLSWEQVLNVLKSSGIRFTIKGRTVTIQP